MAAAALIPISLLFAGAAANKIAEDRVEAERQRKIRAENLRQQGLGAESDARLREELEAQSRGAVEAEKGQQVAAREAKYEQALPIASEQEASYQTTPTAPKEVKSEIARNMVAALRRGRQQAKAQARLGGQADANQQGGFSMMRSGQDLDRIGNRSRASSAILPYELQDAYGRGEGWRTVGDIANTAASIYGLYGMTTPPEATGAYGAKGAARNLFAP